MRVIQRAQPKDINPIDGAVLHIPIQIDPTFLPDRILTEPPAQDRIVGAVVG
jgi:hypothetical protein